MRMMVAAGLAAMALAGCSRDAAFESKTVGSAKAMVAADMAAPQAAEGYADGVPEEKASPTAEVPGAPLLAYVYGADLELPFRNVRATMAKHEAACRAAGPAVCQVLGASVNTNGEDSVSGTVQLRAEPRWLETFRNGLEGEARAAGGRVRGTSVSSEDLTRQIVDTDARLRAQKTLRDRLQQILRSRPGKLSELLETERELTRVQGEIDSAESQLAVMRQRVATSLLNLNYQSAANPVTGGAFRPVVDAFNEFFGIVMGGFGVIIRLLAMIIPALFVIVPGWWLFRRWRRGVDARKAALRKAL